MGSLKHILVVDDEATVREVLRRYLEREGYRVTEAGDGYQALDEIDLEPPDLMILDLMLPGIDGLSITQQLRQQAGKQIPIIMLTAKGETSDRIRGLGMGADDYLAKPFSPRELVLRVNSVLRRSTGAAAVEGDALEISGIVIDPTTRLLKVSDVEVSLSAREFDLLYHFASNPRRVFSREQLLETVWGYGYYGDPSTVTVHIRRLREKIEPDPANPTYIHTVWGVGYKFDPGETQR